MNDEQFEAIMDGWTDEELRAAPALEPTSEMRRLVEARRRAPSAVAARPWKWVVLAAAAAVVLWFGRGFFAPTTTTPESFHVSLHAPPTDLEALRVEGPVPLKKGPKSRGAPFAQVLLQSHVPGGEVVVGVQHDGKEAVSIPLGSGDLFRIALLPLGDQHVHVYVTAGGEAAAATRVFPVEEDPAGSLLPGYALRFVPSTTSWFQVEGATPDRRIVVVSSRDPLGDLEAPGALRVVLESAAANDIDVWEFVLRAR